MLSQCYTCLVSLFAGALLSSRHQYDIDQLWESSLHHTTVEEAVLDDLNNLWSCGSEVFVVANPMPDLGEVPKAHTADTTSPTRTGMVFWTELGMLG